LGLSEEEEEEEEEEEGRRGAGLPRGLPRGSGLDGAGPPLRAVSALFLPWLSSLSLSLSLSPAGPGSGLGVEKEAR